MDQDDLNQALETRELNLSARQLPGVPELVFTCCGLQALNLSANSIGSLPSCLAQLRSITDLDLSFNQLRELPECLGALTCLVSLRAQYNQIERVHPGAVSRLGDCLEELVLADNSLTCLPVELGYLKRLRRLDVRFNPRLTDLPPQLGRLAGSLVHLGLEGCPLGDSGAAGQAQGPGSRPSSATPARKQLQQFYRVLQQVAVQAEAELQLTGVPAPGAVGGRACQALKAVLQQLQKIGDVTVQRPASAAVVQPHADSTGEGTKPTSGTNGGFCVSGGAAQLSMDKQQGTHTAGRKFGAAASGQGSSPAEVLTISNTAVDNHTPASMRTSSGSGRMARPGHLQPLNTHLVAAAGRAAAPHSPLTDLRNSHADLELSYDDDDEEGGQASGPGINIVGDGAGVAPPLSPSPLSPGMSGAVGDATGTSSAMSRALEELADLPPAAAAAMYRSLDMVAAGVQEMREGRPLSRGGTAAALGLPAGIAPPSASSHSQRRPGSSSLRPGSSMGRFGELNRPGTASGSGSRVTTAPGSRQPTIGAEALTGAMALLASAGMGPDNRSAHGGGAGDGQRPASSDAARSAAAASGCDAGGSALGGMAPITFPLASGVRGMLRNGSRGSSRGGQEGVLAGITPVGEAATGARPSGLSSGLSGEATAKSTAQGPVANASVPLGGLRFGPPPDGSGSAASASNSTEVDVLGAALDQLDVVRRLLAARNPHLLEALDQEVFQDGEGEEGVAVEGPERPHGSGAT